MKILHLLKTADGGGWALRQMRELIKNGVEIYAALPAGGALIPEYIEIGVKLYYINYSLKGIYATSKRLREIVKEVNPDIIHSHFVLTTMVMRIALRKDPRPRIFQVPGPLHLTNWFFRNIEIFLAQKNDYWVGSCKWTNECYAKNGIAKSRIFLSYYGGYITNRIPSPRGNLRKELEFDSDIIIVGMVAYMYSPKYYLGQRRGLKGHEDFIDAIALVAQKYPNVRGVCIGGAWGNSKRYEHRVYKYGKTKTNKVFFLGTRDDVKELYPDFFCAVHPSHSENLGGAGESLLECVPTIATNVGGFPDIVIDGVTGVLVEPKNPHAIASKIIDFIEGRYDLDKMTKNGYNLIMAFDIKNTTASLLNVYNQILA